MKFNINTYELWFWRIAIALSLIMVLFLSLYTNVLADRINQNIKYIYELKKGEYSILEQQTTTLRDSVDVWTVLDRMAEDYPPKNKK